MTPFISKLSVICVKKKLINPEDVPWFEYGIEARITTAISTVPFILLAVRLSDIPTALAFLAVFKFLRARTSGYHANSVLGCISVSLILELLFLGIFLQQLNSVTFYVSNGISFTLIFFLAPFVHPNMNFSEEEILALRYSSKRRVMLTTLLALVCDFLNYTAVARGLTTGIAMAAFMLCLAYYIDWRKST